MAVDPGEDLVEKACATCHGDKMHERTNALTKAPLHDIATFIAAFIADLAKDYPGDKNKE